MRHETNLTLCARAAHEVNRAYCAAIGDDSQVPWEEAPEWQRDSAMAGAYAVVMDPNHTPAASHESWVTQKVTDGWVWGEVKDPEAKTHPCLVPYEDLPASQRTKDYLFIAVVRQTIAALEASP